MIYKFTALGSVSIDSLNSFSFNSFFVFFLSQGKLFIVIVQQYGSILKW